MPCSVHHSPRSTCRHSDRSIRLGHIQAQRRRQARGNNSQQYRGSSFNFLAPLDFSSSNYGFGSENEYEATPEVKLGFLTHPHGLPLQFSGFVDESSDRYSGSTPNYDQLEGSVRVDWVGSDELSARERLIPTFLIRRNRSTHLFLAPWRRGPRTLQSVSTSFGTSPGVGQRSIPRPRTTRPGRWDYRPACNGASSSTARTPMQFWSHLP